MRLITALLSLSIIYSTPFASAAVDNKPGTFEKNLQELGKKLDQAKVKTEKAAEKAAEDTKETRKDWSARLSAAATEVQTGLKKAWQQLKGEK
jgi:hypothetical protein